MAESTLPNCINKLSSWLSVAKLFRAPTRNVHKKDLELKNVAAGKANTE